MSVLAKRLALSLAALGVVGALVTGASFALFSATTGNAQNTFAAGTVSLNAPGDYTCNIQNIAPGDSSSDACQYSITYTGSLNAWIGVTTSESGALFAAPTPLTVTITDSNGQSFSPNMANQVVGENPVSQNWTDTFTIGYSFPLAAGNQYQGATGTVNLEVQAVQSANNTNSAGTGPNSWQ